MAQAIQDAGTLEDGGYTDLESLKLAAPLSKFPERIIDHAQTLCRLDLSGTGLSYLPDTIGQMICLRVAFFSNCGFEVFPVALAACPELEMIAFRGNRMKTIPEDCFPEKLRWLILTNNDIEQLPSSIGRCVGLQKCMLAGNRLQGLPEEMVACRKLGLLRLAANRIQAIPTWLFRLPELAFLSLSGNPCCGRAEMTPSSLSILADVFWESISINETLGEGASGIIYKATWQGMNVAVKLFKGEVTSDGTPLDEMTACMAAGQHQNLIDTLGQVVSHPTHTGLVMQLVPSSYKVLGLPPSLQTCTRDCFAQDVRLGGSQALRLLCGIAAAAEHIHSRGISHGDLYAHNILVDRDGNAILGDFGAASVYGVGSQAARFARLLSRLEVLAFGYLIEDVVRLIGGHTASKDVEITPDMALTGRLRGLQRQCTIDTVAQRPLFKDVSQSLRVIEQEYKEQTAY
jgi:hypothetical protein